MKITRLFTAKYKQSNQRGLASIVIVFVLVVLLTLISLSFTRIMDRALQSSTAGQEASAADYAAQSGINDAIAYLKTNPGTTAARCSDLLGTKSSPGPLYDKANLSRDNNRSASYSCVLIDPSPSSLIYQSLDAYKSQVTILKPSATLGKIMFSWQNTNHSNPTFPAVGTLTLQSETAWSTQKYPPLLRVTLYPFPVVGAGDVASAKTNAKTFFLYPQNGTGVSTIHYNDSSLQGVGCSTAISKPTGTFSGTADYDCNVIIDSLPGVSTASYYYVKVTPYYSNSSLKIKGVDGGDGTVTFQGAQSLIDVTAKAGPSVKRLQAQVALSSLSIDPSEDNIPEFTLRSANSLCKRLVVDATISYVTNNCQAGFPPPPSPNFSLSAAPSSQSISKSSSGNFTVTIFPSNGFNSSVALSVISGLPAGASASFSPSSVNGGSWASTMAVNIGSSTTSGTYTLTIQGTSGGLTRTTTVSVTVPSPPADFSISASPSSLTISQGLSDNSIITITPSNGFNSSVTLSGPTGLPVGASSTYQTNPVPGGSGTSRMKITIGATTGAGTYTLTVTATGGGQSHNTSVTVIVKVKRTLTLNVIGNGIVYSSYSGQSCGPAATCLIKYNNGDADTLSYISGTFIGWGGACSGTTRGCNIVMNSDKTVKATFQ